MENIPASRPKKTLRDIRKPKKRPAYTTRFITPPTKAELNFRFDFHPKFRKYLKRSSLVIAGTASIYAILIAFLAQSAFSDMRNIQSEIPAIRASAENLDTGDIAGRLSNIYGSVAGISAKFRYSGMALLSEIAGHISPAIGEIPEILSNISALNEKSLRVAEDLDILKSEGAEMLISQRGGELIGTLENLKGNIDGLKESGVKLAGQSRNIDSKSGRLASLIGLFSKRSAPAVGRLSESGEFLGALIELLKQEDQHILVMLQNPTEMRPAGGFIGSFGDIILSRGNLKEIKIDDIYNADRQLNLRLLPPKELRNITPTWGARDANWFFNFPTSAGKVISLLEESDLFKKNGIRFRGAIAINTNVLQSVLSATEPIAIDKYDMTITPQNFLKELQREVEAGRDKKPGQNPKKILSVLSPILMEKIKNLSDDRKSNLLSAIKGHLENKDIMMYSEDWRMQNFFESLGISGSVLQEESEDYLAVVNANIAGGKTDAVTSQHISIRSAIDAGGRVLNQVSVTREHSGKSEQDWWYSVPNKNYLKLLVPENSTLLSVAGNDRNTLTASGPVSGNLRYDPDLAAIEKTATLMDAFRTYLGRESGKFSFGSWVTTGPGESRTVTFQYQNGSPLTLRNNLEYGFVFEKQSGAEGSLEYSVAAPPGYFWKENGRSIFEYGTQQIRSRERINLTLLKK